MSSFGSLKIKILAKIGLLFLLIWLLAVHKDRIRSTISDRDSTVYWASAKLLIHGGNPYSPPDMLLLERGEGYTAAKPKMLRPPPWSVWMILPLGLLNAYWAWVSWLALLVSCLMISTRLSWRMYAGGAARTPTPFLVAAYTFAPVAACLILAQMGLVLALGMVLFLVLAEEDSYKAGAALILPMAKPHLFAAFWLILLIWIVARKKWAILESALLVFFAANTIAITLDPLIFQHYHAMLGQEGIQNEFIPTMSGMIRGIFFRRHFWIQFMPLAVGILWSVCYYWAHRRTWIWRQNGPWLLIVAALTTPYSFMSDEAALIPAVLQATVWLNRGKLTARARLAVVILSCLNLLLLLILNAKVDPYTGIYFWSSTIPFGWYCCGISVQKRKDSAPMPSLQPLSSRLENPRMAGSHRQQA